MTPVRHYLPAAQAAVIAAVANGMTQRDAATHFKIHRNTVSKWCQAVRKFDHAANPLSKSWKTDIVPRIHTAVESGLDCADDPYRRATIALKLGEGIGYFTSSVQVDTNVAITFAWGPVQENGDVIDVTPAEVNKPASDT